ncbi:uncharacterized protein AB675_7940 [Cyphellophora attinorum]|uniref:F-box domain-containing protein n=1 Tax=Cyphellophora attinorum TaxID=1664694 RepID=A0A0N1NZW9_9EURO|nr:uncharacterized protein AB675_7940 [Phialophora attinorum]KPI41307.1 hypothetical protein AB675_7940 [Phialophora attinorum]
MDADCTRAETETLPMSVHVPGDAIPAPGSIEEPPINKLNSDVFEVLLQHLCPIEMICLALTSKAYDRRIKSSKRVARLSQLHDAEGPGTTILQHLESSLPPDMVYCKLRQSIVPIGSLPETHTHPYTAFCKCIITLKWRRLAAWSTNQTLYMQISDVQSRLFKARQNRAFEDGLAAYDQRQLKPHYTSPMSEYEIAIERARIELDLVCEVEERHPRPTPWDLRRAVINRRHELIARMLDLRDARTVIEYRMSGPQG